MNLFEIYFQLIYNLWCMWYKYMLIICVHGMYVCVWVRGMYVCVYVYRLQRAILNGFLYCSRPFLALCVHVCVSVCVCRCQCV